jgi:CMP-N,N'-diacetyllegionaminic acid synthase
MKKKSFLCIITARQNSKGIKNKNLKKIDNRELIYYPIKAALGSKYINNVVVSTDSIKISKISKKYGANVPFLRPKKFAQDNSPSNEAVEHCINFYQKKSIFYDYFVLLEPTSPLTTSKDIDRAIKLLLENNKSAESLVTVTKAEQSHPIFLVKKGKKDLIRPFFNRQFIFKRRQDISELFFFDGSLYISKVETYLKKKTFNHNKTMALELEKYKFLEIDDKIDLMLAKILIKSLKKKI